MTPSPFHAATAEVVLERLRKLHQLPREGTASTAVCCRCTNPTCTDAPITAFQRTRPGCVQRGHDEFWRELEQDPNSGITSRPTVVKEADEAFRAAEQAAMAAANSMEHVEEDEDEDEDEAIHLELQQLVMSEFALNHEQRKRKTSKDRAEKPAKKADTGQAAQGAQDLGAAAMNTDEIIKALRKKQTPNKKWMIAIIDSLPLRDDGTCAVNKLKEGSHTTAAAADILHRRLREYYKINNE